MSVQSLNTKEDVGPGGGIQTKVTEALHQPHFIPVALRKTGGESEGPINLKGKHQKY